MKLILLTSIFSFFLTNLFGQAISNKDKIVGKKFVGYTNSRKIDSLLKTLEASGEKNKIFVNDEEGTLVKIAFTDIPKKIAFIQEVYDEDPKNKFFIIFTRKENKNPPK